MLFLLPLFCVGCVVFYQFTIFFFSTLFMDEMCDRELPLYKQFLLFIIFIVFIYFTLHVCYFFAH